MFIIVSWVGKKGEKAHIVKERLPFILGGTKIFVTREEAESYCNTELFGWDYAIINLDMEEG